MSDSTQTSFTIRDRETLTKVETKLDRAIEDIRGLSNQFTPKSVFDDLEKRVTAIENGHTWILRLVVGFVILAVLGLVIVTK